MALLAQSTFTIRRLAKDELTLVFSSDTVAIPSKNGVADLSTAEFEVKVLKGGRELFPIFDEEIEVPTGWTSAPEDILTNAILSAHNCTAVVDGTKIKLTSIESGKNAGYVDVTVTYGVGNNVTRRFTWARVETGVSITNVDVEYAVNNNPSTAPTTGWSTLPPISLSSEQQLWTRTVTSYSTGSPTYSVPANITPQVGQGVESIIEEFAISTSKTTQPETGWSTTPPTWVNGSYIWTRTKITYKNPAQVVYTGYAVSSEWEAINELEIGGRNFYSNNTPISSRYRTIVDNRNEGETVNGFKITSVDPYTNNYVRLARVINSNGWWTVSFDVRSDDATHVRIDIADAPDALQGSDREISSEWRRVTCTVDVGNYSEVTYHFVDIGISPFGDYSIEVRNIKVEKGNKATDWTPAPEDVQAEIDSKVATSTYTSKMTQLDTAIAAKVSQTDFNALGQRVSTAEGTLTTQAGLIAAKAEVSSVTALGSRVTTAENTIDAHTGQINSKVSQADYNANNTAIQNQFSNISQRADGIELSVTSVSNKVDEIEIGGRNLAQLTNSKEWRKYTGGTISFGEYKGITTVKSTDNGSGYISIEQGGKAQKMLLRAGEQYTISLLVRGTVPLTYNYIMNTGVANSGFGNFTYEQPLNEETFVKAYLKITGTKNSGLSTGSYFMTRPTVVNEGDWIEITQLKIEKGNKSTDWTPAPEDTQSDYESKIKQAADSISLAVYNKTLDALNPATEIKLTSSSIKLTVADDIATAKSQAISTASSDATTKANNAKSGAISDVTGKLLNTGIDIANKQITLTANKTVFKNNSGGTIALFNSAGTKINASAIELTASDQITLKVNAAKSDAISAAATDATNKVNNLQIGGRNLILNSLNRIGFTSNNGNTYPIQDQAVSGENYRRFRRTYPAGITSTGISTYTSEFFTPEKSGYYTWSTYFRPNEFDIELRVRLGNTYGNFTLCKANEWTQVSATAYIEAGVRTRLYGVHGEMPPEAVQWIDYNRMSVTSGNKATDWSPAPEDTQSDIATAKSEAISTAAGDATTKANNAKSQAISAAATDATNKVNGLKTDLSGTGIDIVAGTLTLYSGAKDGNAGGKVVIAGSNFSVDAEGKVKAVDGEFSGKISATEGTIGSMHLQSNMLVSSSEKLSIDGTNSTITLKDASSDDVRILIKPNNLPTSPSSYFGSTTKSASFTAIKSTITATGTILSSNPITVGANESYTFNIPSVTLTASVTVPETMDIRIAAVATAELYLTDGMLEVPIGNARAASFFGRGSDVTVIPATTRTITSTGNWRLQLRYKLNRGGFSPDQVSGSAQLTSSSSTYSAVPIVNRSEFGANGLIVATSANEYTYMVGNTFEVRRQNHMFRLTSSDIQISKNGGGRWESLHSGMLGVVHFTLGGGVIYQWTKNGAPITLSYTTSSVFRVNHSIGHTDYLAMPVAQAKYGYLLPETKTSSYCSFSKSDIDNGHQITVLLIGNG